MGQGTGRHLGQGRQKASLEIKTTTGNKRRLLTAQILQNEWKQAGFGLTVTPETSGVLFGKDLPGGNFVIGLYAQTPTDNDPGLLRSVVHQEHPHRRQRRQRQQLHQDQRPDAGQAVPHLRVEPRSDGPDRGRQAGQARLAEIVPALPIDPFPDIVVVNSDKIGVEGGTFQHNFAYGPFTYINTWYLK